MRVRHRSRLARLGPGATWDPRRRDAAAHRLRHTTSLRFHTPSSICSFRASSGLLQPRSRRASSPYSRSADLSVTKHSQPSATYCRITAERGRQRPRSPRASRPRERVVASPAPTSPERGERPPSAKPAASSASAKPATGPGARSSEGFRSAFTSTRSPWFGTRCTATTPTTRPSTRRGPCGTSP